MCQDLCKSDGPSGTHTAVARVIDLGRKDGADMSVIMKAGLLSLAAVLLLPSAAGREAPAQEPLVLVVQPAEPAQAEQTVRVLRDGDVQTQELDVYLTQVVLSEMPASFEAEALKAQAVAARTFTCRQMTRGKHENADVCADSACCQACRTVDELQASLGADFDAAWEKAARAVTETEDEVLTYDGALIEAVYFSCSGGTTESAAAVWGSDVPYLQPVESPGEQTAAKYASTVTVPAVDFAQKLQALDAGVRLTGDPSSWVTSVTRTAGGGVETAVIGGRTFRGTQLRGLFGLNSTKFTLTEQDGTFRFDVLGYGHRVGMSQYGANAAAALGFDYRTILRYYYRGVRITAWESP